MGEKKKPGRFTLQFNLEDPQQRTVSELLEQQGRHKAQFLTGAVLHYIGRPEHSVGTPPADEETIERVVLSIIKKHPQLAGAAHSEPPEVNVAPAQPAPAIGIWSAPMGDDAMAAISETLAAFQQG